MPLLLQHMKSRGEKIAMLTCYDASMATLMDRAGVDVLLVGDSLGMVLQGAPDTLGVTPGDMQYHVRAVVAGASGKMVIADMPWRSDRTPSLALKNAQRLHAAGAHMVKLEGTKFKAVRRITDAGIPVCGHLGFTPQSVHALGGYKVQGRDPETARKIMADAVALEQAGASLMVLEMVPASLAREIAAQLVIPVIGIGAGPDCDGQVLVVHDALGMYPGKTLRFVRNFLVGADSIPDALATYVRAVKDGSFPTAEHGF